jgi:ankyrin repeat protein
MRRSFMPILLLIALTACGDSAPDQPPPEDIWQAVNQGDSGEVKRFIEEGADVNDRDQYGNRLIGYACELQVMDLVELLLERGANPNFGHDRRKAPLHIAAFKGDAKLASLLLKHRARVNIVDKYGRTPLDIAEDKGYKEVSAVLRENGGKRSRSLR